MSKHRKRWWQVIVVPDGPNDYQPRHRGEPGSVDSYKASNPHARHVHVSSEDRSADDRGR